MDNLQLPNAYVIAVNAKSDNDPNFQRLKKDIEVPRIRERLVDLGMDIMPNINQNIKDFQISLMAGTSVNTRTSYNKGDINKIIEEVENIKKIKPQKGGGSRYKYKYKKYKAKYLNLNYH